MEVFVQQLINGLTLGSIYGLIAIGYTMVFGIIGMVNFAHGDVFMLSAFIALIFFLMLTTWLGMSSIALALLIVMVILAATVSLRSFRSGGIQTMVLLGMIGGIGFFLLAEISRQVVAAGLLSPALAVGVPIALAVLVSLTVLLHQEDG